MNENHNKTISFHKTHIDEQDINSVVETLRNGWITMGPKTIEFEKKFNKFIAGSKQTDYKSISFNSATAALHLSLKAIGIQGGDEVIIPTNTFIATAEVITYFNANPILCDIDPETHNIDVSKIESLITKNTRAIIPVHFAGQPCDMDEIISIAKKYDLKIIEDAAHALPSHYKGKMIGTIGDITCFSFYATKTLATGEGGMATTSNNAFAESMKINRLHGINRDAWSRYTDQGTWYYEVVDNGNKYNTTDLNSALGISQLRKIQWMKDERERVAKRYTDNLKSSRKITLPLCKKDRDTSWHLYVIKVKNRNELIDNLKKENLHCSVHFIPVHLHPYYQKRYGYKKENYPNANQVFESSLSLPIYPYLTDQEIDYICERVLYHVK